MAATEDKPAADKPFVGGVSQRRVVSATTLAFGISFVAVGWRLIGVGLAIIPVMLLASRYFVVRRRLSRCSNPAPAPGDRQRLVSEFMAARQAVAAGRRASGDAALEGPRTAVDTAMRALGERSPAWWTDGAADCNRQPTGNAPYAAWYATAATRR